MALPLIASAQQFSIGFTGGAPAEPLGRSANKMPFVLGPTVSVGVFAGLSLETGVLFHRPGATDEHYSFAPFGGALVTGTDEWKASAIEIPLLLKCRFLSRSRTWRPFLSAGPTVRRTSIDYNGFRSSFSGDALNALTSEPVRTSETVKWNVDPTAGVGISFKSWPCLH